MPWHTNSLALHNTVTKGKDKLTVAVVDGILNTFNSYLLKLDILWKKEQHNKKVLDCLSNGKLYRYHFGDFKGVVKKLQRNCLDIAYVKLQAY